MIAPAPMAPADSPAGVRPRGGVRRVNNLPLYILVALMGLFLLVMAFVAADRAAEQNRPRGAPEDQAGNSHVFADAIAGHQQGGIIQAEQAPQALPIDIVRPEDLEAPPRPPQPPPSAPASDAHAQRVLQAKLQLLEEAIQAKTGVHVAPPRSAGSAPQEAVGGSGPAAREQALARWARARQQTQAQPHAPGQADPTAAYQARLRQLQGLAPAPPDDDQGYAALERPQAPPEGAGRWQLAARPQAPRSPYVLRAGFVLPAVLISGINSDLPGQIMAQVSQDVFDTATGRWKLIPQGARLVGQYASELAYGQARVLVAWQRIIFPDGKALDIGAMPGADGAGRAGLQDQANHHYVRLFGAALLMSGVTAGIALSQQDAPSSYPPYGSPATAASAMREALGQQLGQVTAQLIAKNMGIAPTLEIRPGYRFNVIVTQDMTFPRPYQAFDYQEAPRESVEIFSR